ncbi:3'-N-debenzoyl-2'-deoxytaxol N-benzoyltransferase [Carex littledalei]|uniref:3'-N-debenzoyl-2'-deoxytaxol N-benzoyltransferase n=1 Tax=Carex littledalei TaxID=544730 RepID=A0A833VZC1_9POAL|nr:3'-N-debenzoyl-2'-deoxytaxol N-benzoyltransferase [Carex littledalei]
MSYTVTKSSPVLVPPATSTPTGTLPLSSIDRIMTIHIAVDFVSVFSHGEQPGERIKEAFAKALVPYYPVAGRIAEPIPGVSVIDCSGEGICINRIKDKFTAETAKKCTTFEVITAIIYISRAKAIKLADTAEVRIAVAACTRHLLQRVMPSLEGYYGNCVYPFGITKTSQEMNNASLVEVITLIKDAKDALSTKFVDWMNGVPNTHYNFLNFGYGMAVVSDWRWVGFNEVDYGWGKPKYVFNWSHDVNIVGMVIYLNPPKPKRGIRLMMKCVKEEHSAEFCDGLLKLIHQDVAEIV